MCIEKQKQSSTVSSATTICSFVIRKASILKCIQLHQLTIKCKKKNSQVHTDVRIPRALPSDDNDVHTFRDNSLNNNESDFGDDRNPFFQWISGILGITTTEKPVVLMPPEKCDECSKSMKQ